VATIAARTEIAQRTRALGLWVAETDANFIWVALDERAEAWAVRDGHGVDSRAEALAAFERHVVQGLRERRVVVRAGSALGRTGSLRVTTGTDDENERYLSALATLV